MPTSITAAENHGSNTGNDGVVPHNTGTPTTTRRATSVHGATVHGVTKVARDYATNQVTNKVTTGTVNATTGIQGIPVHSVNYSSSTGSSGTNDSTNDIGTDNDNTGPVRAMKATTVRTGNPTHYHPPVELVLSPQEQQLLQKQEQRLSKAIHQNDNTLGMIMDQVFGSVDTSTGSARNHSNNNGTTAHFENGVKLSQSSGHAESTTTTTTTTNTPMAHQQPQNSNDIAQIYHQQQMMLAKAGMQNPYMFQMNHQQHNNNNTNHHHQHNNNYHAPPPPPPQQPQHLSQPPIFSPPQQQPPPSLMGATMHMGQLPLLAPPTLPGDTGNQNNNSNNSNNNSMARPPQYQPPNNMSFQPQLPQMLMHQPQPQSQRQMQPQMQPTMMTMNPAPQFQQPQQQPQPSQIQTMTMNAQPQLKQPQQQQQPQMQSTMRMNAQPQFQRQPQQQQQQVQMQPTMTMNAQPQFQPPQQQQVQVQMQPTMTMNAQSQFQPPQQQQQMQMQPTMTMNAQPQFQQPQQQMQMQPTMTMNAQPQFQQPQQQQQQRQNHPPSANNLASHPQQHSLTNGTANNNSSGHNRVISNKVSNDNNGSNAAPSTLFGLPPVPQSIQEFAALPIPTNLSQLPPTAVLESDLVIYEYIALRARTIADELDASVTRIRNAIQKTQPSNKYECESYHYEKNTSERSFSNSSQKSNNSNAINHGRLQGTAMNQNSERSYRSRNSTGRINSPNKQHISTIGREPEVMKHDTPFQTANRRDSNDMICRLASIADEHRPRSVHTTNRKHHDTNQIVSVIKNASNDPHRETLTIPKTIVTLPTKSPNASAASSFSVPLRQSYKSPVDANTTTALPTLTKRDMIVPQQLLQLEDSSNSDTKRTADESKRSDNELKRHVSDELTKITNIDETDDVIGLKEKESTVTSYKARELEKIKEEVRILAQYADFSRRVLDKKGAEAKMHAIAKLCEGQVRAVASTEIESRVNELETIKAQARQIASRTRKIIDEEVPQGQTTNPPLPDDLDVSGVTDATMLVESARSPNHGNDIHAIRGEARLIAQYTYQIVAGAGGDAQSNVGRHNAKATSRTSTRSIPVGNPNNIANSSHLPTKNAYTSDGAAAEDSDTTEDEARILMQLHRMPKKSSSTQSDVPATQSPNLIDQVSEISNNSPIVATSEIPLENRNSIGELISDKRAKELERIKEEARLLAMQVQRTNKRKKRLSNGTIAPPETDYVLNPDVDRSLLDASLSKLKFVTWKDLIGDSEWVTTNDIGVAADSVILSLAQFGPCRLREDDKSGRYSHIEIGYIGICCNHCYGQAGYGRYFPTTLPSFVSAFPSTVVKHILDDCTTCPKWIKDIVHEVERVTQRSPVRNSSHTGSKSLFQYVWDSIRKTKPEDIDALEATKRRKILQAPIAFVSNTVTWEELLHDSDIVAIEDQALVSNSFLALWGQFQKCIADETDSARPGRWITQKIGTIGYCCRHCKGEPYAAGARLFPSSSSTLYLNESIIDSMRTHINSVCMSCPDRLRTALLEFEGSVQLLLPPKHGSKKMFFQRIWNRLYNTTDKDDDDITNTNIESINTLSEVNATVEGQGVDDAPIIDELIADSVIVTMNERGLVPDSVLVAYGQLKPCRLDILDKTGWYKDREIGFPGLCCKHCRGRPSSGRYFPKTGDNFLRSSKYSIMRHLLELCMDCPGNVRRELQRLQKKDALQAEVDNVDETVLGAGKKLHSLLWVRLYKYYNVPHGYYEAIHYAQQSKERMEARILKITTEEASPSHDTDSTPFLKKRKVDYGRSKTHRGVV